MMTDAQFWRRYVNTDLLSGFCTYLCPFPYLSSPLLVLLWFKRELVSFSIEGEAMIEMTTTYYKNRRKVTVVFTRIIPELLKIA